MTRLIILLVFAMAMLGCTAAEPHSDSHVAHEEMPATENTAEHMAGSDEHSGHGAESHNSAEPIPGAAEIRIIATEFGYEPAQISLTADEPVNIVLVNEGAIEHELVIKELNFHAHAEAGETVTVGFTADETGEYEFGCYIAGHYEAGMFGETIIGN